MRLETRRGYPKSTAERIQAAVLGAAKATNEYVAGDLDAARAVRLDLLKDAPEGNR